jgi:hypothetical protein
MLGPGAARRTAAESRRGAGLGSAGRITDKSCEFPHQHSAGGCAPRYSRAHRVWRDKVGTLAKYGIPLADAGRYEDDDRAPMCLGGDNASPLNHWPEPWDEAERKDELERRICRAVCSGRLTLPAESTRSRYSPGLH